MVGLSLTRLYSGHKINLRASKTTLDANGTNRQPMQAALHYLSENVGIARRWLDGNLTKTGCTCWCYQHIF